MKVFHRTCTFTATLLMTTLLLGGSQCVVAADSASPNGIKNVVLVHGAFACVFRARKATDSRHDGPWFRAMSVQLLMK